MLKQYQDSQIKKLPIGLLYALILIFISGMVTAQIAPTINPAGGFHIDGGLISNTPTDGVGDWIYGPGTSNGYVLNTDGSSIDSLNTHLIIDSYNTNSDHIFQGSKFNDDPNAWSWAMGKASSKNDINNAYYHLAKDASNNTWLIVGGDRLSTTGTSYIDFEFLQNTITRDNMKGFVSEGTDGGRTLNDMVISMEYSNGGSNANVHFYLWNKHNRRW